MLIKSATDILPSEITSHSAYLNRRKFMQKSGLALTALGLSSAVSALETHAGKPPSFGPDWLKTQVAGAQETSFGKDEKLTPYRDVTTYNNFYEFGTGKTDPARNAGSLITDPWAVTIEGECEKQGTFNFEDILKHMPLEERIYRLRCVEAWSMVIPWIGFPLAELIKRFKPLSTAKYVEFTTLEAPKQMVGQRSRFSTIDWPYVEGLRMDEAMNPLTLMAVSYTHLTLPTTPYV